MFKLRLFGTPHLQGPSGDLPAPGPRRVALIASLAAAGPAGLTRDKLIARLSPDTNEDRARRNLSQALYSMRTELGAELVDGTGTLRLDPAQCWCDVMAFDAAVTERRDADAVELYRGPFLDGFHLSESAEFSQWADGERDRREAAARSAAVRVAEAVSAGDAPARLIAWQRAVALDPLNSHVVLNLFDALAAAGDREGALRSADQYAARVRADLETEPDAKVVRRAEELRRSPRAWGDHRPTAPALSPELSPPTTHTSGQTSAPVTTESVSGEGTRSVHVSASSRAFGGRTIVVVATAAVAGIAILAWSVRAPAALRDGEFVLLAEFANRTSDSLLTGTVGTAVAAALQQSAIVTPLPRSRVTAALRRMEHPDTVERLDVEVARDVAEREAVRFVLAGEVIEAGGVRQLISRIIEASTGRVVATRTFRFTHDAELFPAIDRLASAMRRDLGESARSVSEAVPLPAVTTPSLPALHFYAEGIDALRRTDHDVAVNLFERAVALDSNFASAHSQLGAFYNRNNDLPKASYHFNRALAQADRLPLAEAQLIHIAAAYARGDMDEAVGVSRQYLVLRPRDAGGWARLAFYLFSSGQGAEARDAYATSDRIAPLSAGSVMNIGTSWLSDAHGSDDVATFDSARVYYERAIRTQPSLEYSAYYNHQYGTILLGAGRPDSARATFDRMSLREPLDRARGLRSNAYLDAVLGRWRTADERLGQATELTLASQQWTSAIRNDALQADLRLTLGDVAGARAPLRRATAIALREPLEARAIAFVALAQIKAGDRAAASRLLTRMRTSARPQFAAEQAAVLSVEGALALAAGRTGEARTALSSAFLRDSTVPQTRALYARAVAAAGEDSASVALWGQIERRFEFGIEGQYEWQFAAYERGIVLERMGRTEQAMAEYRGLIGRYPVVGAGAEPPALRDARRRLNRLERSTR